jgi:excisionase family DNA binding protein
MPMKNRDPDMISLPEVARVLGVHRATVNDMVLQRKLRARRRLGQWYVPREEMLQFAATYKRPSNAPVPRDERLVSESGWEILSLLVEWGDATTAELDRIVGLHIGNIRKQLNLLAASHLAERSSENTWSPTAEGREADLLKRPASSALDIAS